MEKVCSTTIVVVIDELPMLLGDTYAHASFRLGSSTK